MAQTFIGRKRVRKFFGKIEEVAEMPNLIEVQKASYDQFLLVVEPHGGRPNEGLQAVFKSVFPISDFSNTSMLEFVKYEFEGSQIRRRRVPPARHDLCRAAQGHAASDRVRYRRRDRRQVGQGHQGAGCLHGRHSAHDQQRHLHRQRHRARHRLADASLARRVLRSRQGQDPFVGQAAVCRPHHSLSRLLARHRVRRQGHRLCARRPPPQDSGDVAALCARHERRGNPQHLLQAGALQAHQGRLARAVRRQPAARLQGDQRSGRRRHRQSGARGRQEAHRAPGAAAWPRRGSRRCG